MSPHSPPCLIPGIRRPTPAPRPLHSISNSARPHPGRVLAAHWPYQLSAATAPGFRLVCFSRDYKSCFGIGRATPIHRSGPPPGSLQRVQQVRRSRSDCCHLLVAGFGVATLFHVHRTPRPSPEPEVRLLCGMLRGRGTRSPRAPLPALYPT